MKTILQILVFFGCIGAIAQNILELNPTNFTVTAPCGFTKFNNQLYYVGTTTTYGREMWKTGGTADTNQLLKDIGNEYNVAQVSGFIDQTAQAAYGKSYVYNGNLFFNANDFYAQNHFRPYISDGTTAGTVQFDPTSSKINTIRYFKEFNGLLYFTAYNPTYGYEIWSTDGTLVGTNLLKDINPNTGYGVNFDPGFCVMNGKMYFKADDGVHGIELWSTDGTAAGTSMVLDINSGTNDSSSIGAFLQNSNFLDEHLKVVGDHFYFRAYEANVNTNSIDLYVSDGTAIGTHRISYTIPGNPTYYYDGQGLTVLNNQLYFYGSRPFPNSGGGIGIQHGIFTTDGTTDGTILIKDLTSNPGYFGDNGWSDKETTPGSMRVINDKAYFLSGLQLWRTDGTAAGTVQITNNPTDYFDYQKRLISQAFDGKLYFIQNYGPVEVQGIYSVNNNDATITSEAKYVTSASATASTLSMTTLPSELVSFDNSLYFSAGYSNGTANLWRLRNTTLETVHFETPQIKLTVFPNPASDHLNIQVTNLSDSGTLKIISITGQTLFEVRDFKTTDFRVDVSSWTKGIYLIHYSDGNVSLTKKFIKT